MARIIWSFIENKLILPYLDVELIYFGLGIEHPDAPATRWPSTPPGDTVRISVGGKGAQSGLVDAGGDAYTPMPAAATPDGAKTCATVRTGTTGCTARP